MNFARPLPSGSSCLNSTFTSIHNKCAVKALIECLVILAGLSAVLFMC